MSGLIVDLFAGGGGASTGLSWALGRSPDLGINHDWDALRNHALNHPETDHLVDDLRAVSPLVVTRGERVDVLWASPDCRNFSRAKGGKPCHPKIRTLPWEVTRWAVEAKPRVVCVENVPEMQEWGPLCPEHSHGCESTAELRCDHGSYEDYAACRECKNKKPSEDPKCSTKRCTFSRPIPEQTKTTWRRWIEAFEEAGYKVKWWVLHAHHYGAPTSRKRMFLVARRDGVEPVKPEPTHGPGLLPYRTAAECIDWSDLGESIFDEEGNTHHAPATLRRIATGVMRYVVHAKQPFIVTCNHQGDGFRGQGIDEPFRTVTANRDAHGVVTPVVVPCLVQTSYGERKGQKPRVLDLHKPLGTCVAGGQKHAVVAAFLAKHYGGVVGIPATSPMGTVTTKDHHSVVAASLIRTDNTSDGRLRGLASPNEPLKTQTTATGHALVAANLLKLYGTNESGAPADAPLGTVTAGGMKHGIVAAFLATYYGKGVGSDAKDPLRTITTKDRHAVVTVEIDGVTYAIVDIRMRMVKPSELKLAQGFPWSYVLEGTQKLQVRLIGNSVPPQLSEAVVRANTPTRNRPRVGMRTKVRIA